MTTRKFPSPNRQPLDAESAEHFRIIEAFDNINVGVAVLLSGMSIEEAVSLGAVLKADPPKPQ
jgi:hypothetical protein